MYIKIFFSFLLSGIMIQFFKIYNVVHNLNLLQNFKKYFFIIFNQKRYLIVEIISSCREIITLRQWMIP